MYAKELSINASNMGCRCGISEPKPNLIFVGSEHGLWVSFDRGESFLHWKNDDFPAVSTFDLAEQEREADLVIATFGTYQSGTAEEGCDTQCHDETKNSLHIGLLLCIGYPIDS